MFYIDNMMLAHVIDNVVTENVKMLDIVCGLVDPLNETRVKHHECLRITLNFAAIKNDMIL